MNLATIQVKLSINIFISLIMKIIFTKAINSDLTQDMLKNLCEEINPYQLIIFTSDTLESTNVTIIQEYPTSIVSLNHPEIFKSQFLQKSELLSLVILFTINPNEGEILFGILEKLSPLH